MSKEQDWLEFAKNIATRAGEMIVSARQQGQISRDYKAGHELVTSTDLAVDQYLVSAIKDAYPQHQIFSEESSPNMMVNLGDDELVWVLDPIDGTVNFAHGLEHVAVSIGLVRGGQRVLGVVEAPFLHKQFWALLGQGAYCNDKAIHVSGNKVLRNALVATGFPYVKNDLPRLMAMVTQVLSHCQDVRRNGSAALDLCAVAEGNMDAYYESVKPWDMAAGALIAAEAGAKVGCFGKQRVDWPSEINGDSLLVTTPDLYQSILDMLNKCEK